mgnify:CR=1 FL=1
MINWWWSSCIDTQTSSICDGLDSIPVFYGVPGRGTDRGAIMRNNETGNGQVIDFEAYRARRAVCQRASASGSSLRGHEVMR